MSSLGVFSRIRFEHDERPLFFLPDVLGELEQAKSRYLIGNRGTGKTTLLRAMHWRERLENASLRSQLGDDPFAERYIGIYVKTPGHHFSRLNRWLENTETELSAGIFAWYLDAVWLQLAAVAVAELVSRGYFEVPPEEETQVLRDALEEYSEMPWSTGSLPTTLLEFRRVMRNLQWRIEGWARTNADPTVVAGEIPGQIGEFGRAMGRAMLSLCGSYRPAPDAPSTCITEPWRFHVCLDEAEAFSPRQQLALNTVVRLAETPVFILASFVSRPLDVTTTVLPGITLQHADLELTVRDAIADDEFSRLMEGVATARIRSVLGPDADSFDIESALGSSNINGLILKRIATSERDSASQLLTDARTLADKLRLRGGRERPEEELPVWEAYVLRKRHGEIPDVPSDTTERFPDGDLRKRSVTAYFAIHSQYGWKPRYVGGKVAVHLADSCIRDFLWQMDEVLGRIGDDDLAMALRRLTNGTVVPAFDQNAAFVSASRRKVARLKELVTSSPEATSNIVLALGWRTAEAQRATETGVLDAEPGIYVLDGGSDEEIEQARLLIRDGVESGYLKLLDSRGDRWEFRLHNSLAPYFKLSWRGAYRRQLLGADEVIALALATDMPRRPPGGSRRGRRARDGRQSGSGNGGQPMLDLGIEES